MKSFLGLLFGLVIGLTVWFIFWFGLGLHQSAVV